MADVTNLRAKLADALAALEKFTSSMTVGERYTDGGEAALDALMPLREAIAAIDGVKAVDARPMARVYLVPTPNFRTSEEGTHTCTCGDYPHAPWCGPWSVLADEANLHPNAVRLALGVPGAGKTVDGGM